MLAKLVSDPSVKKELVSLVDIVAYRRPPANRLFDQIYMMTGDMLTQVDLMHNYINDKKVIFLGDGDGMSMLFGLFSVKDIIKAPREMTVLDFDQRIINNVKSFSNDFKFHSRFEFNYETYNVINPVPPTHRERYNFFYINPPYGSKNAGGSTEAWLHRCMDLCTNNSAGCIIVPYDIEQPWTIKAMISIQKFLLNNGFVIRDMVSYMHSYHLKDNPMLKSATLIVDRYEKVSSPHSTSDLPPEFLRNLYGSPRAIPKYIRDDGLTGVPDYGWKYGEEFWDK
ncbi:MAG: bis-aminopropyl spermidine synthase family protein [Firmicutes bacterium]|nr:bis-aminopropyl spermidine synthase family protein [Bacillota bacterium]